MLERVDAALGEHPRSEEASPPIAAPLGEPSYARALSGPAPVGAPAKLPSKLGDSPKPALGEAGCAPKPLVPLTFTGRPRPANEP
jgi:hypothetical protein